MYKRQVLLNSVIGLIQEGKAEEALKSLEKLSAPAAKVVRKGQVSVIPSREIVPGDIVLLDAGDKVPADIRLIETHSLECNESSLTGESLPVGKNADVDLPVGTVLAERTNIAYSGTVVTAGRGRGIAVATGMNTEMGRIAGAIHGIAREKTPLPVSYTHLDVYKRQYQYCPKSCKIDLGSHICRCASKERPNQSFEPVLLQGIFGQIY